MANKPTNPSLWSKAKSLARQKFDVYPSAYANGWAAKWYKGKGGGWRKAANGGSMIEDTEIAYQYGGDPSIPNLNYSDMYFYATGGVPNNPGFNALPEEVQRKIIANMKRYGGPSSMGYYQGDMGSSTVMDFYDMDAMYPEVDPMLGETYMESRNPMYVAPTMIYDQMGPLPPAAVQKYQTAIAAPQTKLAPYQGVSVVDFLNTQGVASDYKTRKKLAESLGMTNYRGTADQNAALISTIVNNPDALLNAAKGTSSKKSSKSQFVYVDPESGTGYTQEDLDAIDRGLREDARKAIAAGQKSQSASSKIAEKKKEAATADPNKTPKKEGYQMGPQEIAAVTGLGIGSIVYITNKLGKNWVANNAQYLKDLSRAGLSADDIIKAAKAGGRTEETLNLLRARGMSMQDANKALKGIKFGPKGSVSPEVIKGGEEAVARVKNLVENAEKARKQAGVLVQLMRDRGVRDPKSMAKLEQLIPNTAERMKMLKGIPMPKLGAVQSAVQTGAKGLGRFGKYAKYLKFFEDGGGYVNPFMPMYQGDQGASEYEGDIEFNDGNKWYSEGNEFMPWWAEMLDPTGVSSWDDLARTIKDPKASGWDVALESLGVIPVVGKIGKGAKLAKEGTKAAKGAKNLSTTDKVLRGAGKVVRGAGTALDWATGMAPLRMAQTAGRYNPLAMMTRGAGQALQGSPKIIKLLNTTSEASRIGRSGKIWDNTLGKYITSKEILQQQPQEMVKIYTDDGTIMEVGSHDPLFMEAVERNALDTTGQFTDPSSGAIFLDTSKFAGPRDWGSVRKKYGKGRITYAVGGDTYSAGVFYPDGGTFIPTYADMAYGVLPEYEMGSNYAYGGIHIKPENRGKFTAKANKAGMSVQQFASAVLSAPKGKYSASTRKQANFAKNAAGWKKQDGGIAAGQEMYVTPEEMEALRQQGYEFDIM